jgi:hypothetical protein
MLGIRGETAMNGFASLVLVRDSKVDRILDYSVKGR